MEEFILFLLTFLFVFIFYQIFIVSKAKRLKKKNSKKNDWEVMEISYLVKRYHIDLDKISYPQLLQIVAITSSFDISLVISIIFLLPNFILEIVVGIISMVLLILISYHLVYLFYKKKGMIKK
ncbi:MAG: hypothetical protein IKE70_03830 [Bacilli bacterium]|nr:hypothetical protein [Bacilli bacterium]